MSFPSPFFRWRPHPWHGLDSGPQPPEIVHAYIELTPFDRVKYELDKQTGYLHGRPSESHFFVRSDVVRIHSSRTFCGKRVRKHSCPARRMAIGDPLDICVISERPITVSEVILKARIVGGLPMLDDGEADDKIIAVLHNDNMWNDVEDVSRAAQSNGGPTSPLLQHLQDALARGSGCPHRCPLRS